MNLDSLLPLAHGLYVLFLALVLLFVSQVIYARTKERDMAFDLTIADNPAVAIHFGCYTLAIGIIIAAVASGKSQGWLSDAMGILIYGIVGNFLLLAGSRLQFSLFQRHIPALNTIYSERNVAVALVRGATHVANGLIIAGCLSGEGGGPQGILVYFLLGQIVLGLVARFYQRAAGFNLTQEIQQGNSAAGLSSAGGIVAAGIILFHASSGTFTNWASDLQSYALHAVIGLLLVPCLRWLFDLLWVPGVTVCKEIAEDKNWGLALLEFILLQVLAVLFAISFS